MRIPSALASILFLCACHRWPASYAVPPQYSEHWAPSAFVIRMSTPEAPRYFVSGISPKLMEGSWRWTGPDPTLRTLIALPGPLKYVADFSLWDGGMRQTGPVTLTFLINGRVLDRLRCDTPGAKHFEKTVPAGWMSPLSETTFGARIDKLYTAPTDHLTFGFILTQIGFMPE